jgi:putative hemolysin
MIKKLIDIERVIGNKNPKLLKWLPKFIINYLKKLLHQEEINKIIEDNENTFDTEFCQAVVDTFKIKLEVIGLDNMPANGGCIVAANHPLGGMDAMAIVSAVSPVRKDVKFVVNDVLLHLTNLKNLFVGMNKFGSTSKGALQSINDLFSSNNAVFIFPSGLVSRKKNGIIKDTEWKKTFITQAKKHQKPIIPIYIEGNLSNRFYRISNFRKWLGIKINFEMIFLADEMFKQTNKTVRIVIGEAIMPNELDQDKSDRALAQKIKEKVYSLAKKL